MLKKEMKLYESVDAKLYFSLLAIAEKPTPALVFNLNGIEQRMQALQKFEKEFNCQFLMAVKAFPAKPVIEMAAKYLSGFDISNLNEQRLISKFKNRKIVSVTSPNMDSETFFYGRGPKSETIFVCDQISQLEALLKTKASQTYMIRVNCDSLLRKKDVTSRFGFYMSELSSLQKTIKKSQHKFLGYHFHNGWQGNKLEDYLLLAKNILRITKKMNQTIQVLNLGGGFGNFTEVELSNMLRQIRKVVPGRIKLCFETGRFLAQNSGFAVGHIQQVNQAAEGQTVVLNLSKDCHLQWSTVRILKMNEMKRSDKKEIFLCGPTCSEFDSLGRLKGYFLERHKIGEGLQGLPVFFSNVSSYSMARNQSFNGIPKAKVHFIR